MKKPTTELQRLAIEENNILDRIEDLRPIIDKIDNKKVEKFKMEEPDKNDPDSLALFKWRVLWKEFDRIREEIHAEKWREENGHPSYYG